MTADRLTHAFANGLSLPNGPLGLFGAPGDYVLPDGNVIISQRRKPAYDAWIARGATVVPQASGPFCASIVCLPRARAEAEALIATAAAATPGGLLVIDGAKTDGIDAIFKALKPEVALQGPVAKAHGKVAWYPADQTPKAWARPETSTNAHGDTVAPGVFSADGADPGSQALADALPAKLPGAIADFGAGWGWLSRAILDRPQPTSVHLVEADHRALDCARANVTDPRAQFHWADVSDWTAPEPIDTVITNPPFHVGRRAEPALGQAFILAAARVLAPHGALWLVANTHLPYETAMTEQFQTVRTVTTTARFKVLHAHRPKRARR